MHFVLARTMKACMYFSGVDVFLRGGTLQREIKEEEKERKSEATSPLSLVPQSRRREGPGHETRQWSQKTRLESRFSV